MVKYIKIIVIIIVIIALYGLTKNFLYRYFTPLDNIYTGTETATPSIKGDVIVDNLGYNNLVKSPAEINGRINTSWIFEGVFVVKILDSNRNVIAQTQGRELEPGSWTQSGIIPFTANVTFFPTTKTGFLVIENDNPSGLPEIQKSYEIPVRFK